MKTDMDTANIAATLDRLNREITVLMAELHEAIWHPERVDRRK